MIESQKDFSNGINTLLPANRLPDGFSQLLSDGEVYDGTVKQINGFGNDGTGGSVYYYEAGGSWVSGEGFGTEQHTQLEISVSTIATQSATFLSPLIIPDSLVYTINENVEITVHSGIVGFSNANSYVEYEKDLFIGRSKGHVTSLTGDDKLAFGANTFKISNSDASYLHPGDTITVSNFFLLNTKVTQVSIDLNDVATITVDKKIQADSNDAESIAFNAAPIRVVDGKLSTTYKLGFKPPTLNATFYQSGSARSLSPHTNTWYSNTTGFYPIPYQYGISEYDSATGSESGMSALTDPSISSIAFDSSSVYTNMPVYFDFASGSLNNVGRYALYRTGGTSSLIKRVANIIYNTSWNLSFTPDGDELTVSISSLPACRFRLRWYAFNGRSYAVDSNPHAKNGVTEYESVSQSENFSKVFYENANLEEHYIDVIGEAILDDDQFERVYVLSCATRENNTDKVTDFLDFTPPLSLVNVSPITNTGLPPVNMSKMKEVNNFFFGVVDRTLYISGHADPNNWPLNGYLKFDDTITALGRRGSDLLVFTQFHLYRVYGSAPESMRKTQVPTLEGCPADLHKCVQALQHGTIYVSHNGICFYDGTSVTNITKGVIDSFTLPDTVSYSKNISGVFDNKYYLVASDGTGYIIDMRQGLRVMRTSITANNLHYRGVENKLYDTSGYLGGPEKEDRNFTLQTKDFDAGDPATAKLFHSIRLTGEDFKGTVNVLIDGVASNNDTITYTDAIPRLDRVVRFNDARRGQRCSVKVTNGEGRLKTVDVQMSLVSDLMLQRFDYVEIQYVATQDMTISILVDSVLVIEDSVLTTTAIPKTVQVYFPTMTEGYIAHLKCSEDENNQITKYKFVAENV